MFQTVRIRSIERLMLPDVVAVRVRLLAELYRAVAMEELLEERAARQPHPHARVHRPVSVQQEFVEHLRSKQTDSLTVLFDRTRESSRNTDRIRENVKQRKVRGKEGNVSQSGFTSRKV